MKFGRIVLQVNTHRITESGFRFKMAATTSFHATKCCHLVSEHEASARRLCSSVRQFLIYSTFVFVRNGPYILSRVREHYSTECPKHVASHIFFGGWGGDICWENNFWTATYVTLHIVKWFCKNLFVHFFGGRARVSSPHNYVN